VRGGRLDDVLRDAWNGELQADLQLPQGPARARGRAAAALPQDVLARNSQSWSSFDLGRGCPFQCSFCTIINVQGRKSRFRTPEDLEAIIRENQPRASGRTSSPTTTSPATAGGRSSSTG
jgi:radical SAM superfamily enzyme YgiQ (UPF0313 family)